MRLISHAEPGDPIGGDHGASVRKILDGTLRAIRDVGARRLSMSDISEASGVSRGTLYRYFPSKEQVLAAVSEYVCTSFERGIVEAGEGIGDPIERFRRVMHFYAHFTIERAPEQIFEVEPRFHLEFLRSHFTRHKAAVLTALDPSLDYLETLIAVRINRDSFVDTLVRLQLSTLIVPASAAWVDQWSAAPDTLLGWALQFARRSSPAREDGE